MREVKLGEVCKQAKRIFEIDDQTEYKRCRVQLHYRGVVLRDLLYGHEIKTKKQQLCKSGDFIVAEMDAKLGGYGFITKELDDAIVSSHYYLFTIDQSKLLPEYLWILAKMGVLQRQTRAQGSTNYSSVRPKAVLNFVIPLPDLETQKQIISSIHQYEELLEKTNDELQTQSALIAKLRASILSDAVSGRLVPQDSNDEPASILLEKIRAEKERLIKEGKIKREKPLPPIVEDEIPYELPEGWVWCRLGSVCNNIHYGYTASAELSYGEPKMLRITDIQNNSVNWNTVPHCKISDDELDKYRLQNRDILVARTGGTVGKSFLMTNIPVKSVFASYLIRLIPSTEVDEQYLKIVLESPLYWKQLIEKSMGTGQPNVNGTSLSELIISLAPMNEQLRIVTKVEQLMATCDALEAEVAKSRTETDRLMQTTLKEAFK